MLSGQVQPGEPPDPSEPSSACRHCQCNARLSCCTRLFSGQHSSDFLICGCSIRAFWESGFLTETLLSEFILVSSAACPSCPCTVLLALRRPIVKAIQEPNKCLCAGLRTKEIDMHAYFDFQSKAPSKLGQCDTSWVLCQWCTSNTLQQEQHLHTSCVVKQ